MLRLDKFLCDCGKGTRSEVKKLIKQGKVCVNGTVTRDGSLKINETDTVTLNNKPVIYEKYIYLMLNKPKNTVSATEDGNDKTVIDLVKSEDRRNGLFPCGRLDKDTTGLLILTNDGELAHDLLSPRKHVQKTYFAEIEGIFPENAPELFEKGLDIGEFVCKSAKLIILSENEGNTEAEITLTEGKFHQVKKMVAFLGCRVTELKRISFGALSLDPRLKEGEYRPLTPKEIALLKER